MLCSSIKLTNRKEVKRDPTPQKIKSEKKLLMTSDYCHSYSFRWDKPKLFYNYDSSHFLTVNNIILPESARAFNTGSSLEKWSKKRPRLKSTKLKPPPSSSSDDNFDVTPLIEEISKESVLSPEANDSESEMDPDIKNLLSVVQDGYMDEEEKEEDADNWRRQHKKHRHKRKEKTSSDGVKEKSKKKKAIKFSLSKPPSPQTVQVIRVEVTSNYSLDEPQAILETERVDFDISDCSRGCGLRIKSANELKKSLTRSELEDFRSGKEIVIQCNKLVLSNRK